MPTETKTIIKRVTDYGPKPRSARQALIQAHAFLAEEGQWVKGTFFTDGDPKDAYESAQCSSWGACAMGALGLVTGEMPISVHKEWTRVTRDDLRYEWFDAVTSWETELGFKEWVAAAGIEEDRDADYFWVMNDQYNDESTPMSAKAAQALAAQISTKTKARLTASYCDASAVDLVIALNDSKGIGRTKLLDIFEKAIRAEGGEPLDVAAMPKKAARPS